MKKMKPIFSTLILIALLSHSVSSQVLIDWGEQWSYYKGNNEPSLPNTLWHIAGFNASEWPVGNAPFRFGDGTGGTFLSDMMNSYTTFYILKNFSVDNVPDIDELQISVDYDDGFILWINGNELVKSNVPSNLAHNQVAPYNHESGETDLFLVAGSDASLESGLNTIAVQGFNVSKTSSDFYLDLKLVGVKKLPEAEPVNCNVNSGYFTEPFSVSLTAIHPGETIKYSLDGSDPRNSATAITTISPATIIIDPNSVLGNRGRTGGVVMRASTFLNGFDPSKPITRTYIYINSVIHQQHPGGAWPSGNVNGQIIDLEMDPDVTSHDSYKQLMEDAFLDMPAISVTTDPGNIFDSRSGIYVNAQFHGIEWERPANIELIYPDGSSGFNIDAGIRIRGGWSRHDDYPKHAFRIFFRSVYGEGKLDYPLFGVEGVDEFDKIDLRTSQNYSWANAGSEAHHNTMNRDVFSRETQRDMKQPYTRSRYYHLYLNGLYWGVYQSQERAESNFAETYFGGTKEDYDVIKVDIGDNWNLYEIEAPDGNTDAWEVIWNMSRQGFASNMNYFKLLGRKWNGDRDADMPVWIDIDNFIDYMLTIFYAGNFDAPVSKFSNNYNPNNFVAIFNREKKQEGFRFFNHDAEHTLLTDPVGPGAGLYENRVTIPMNVTNFSKFHPQWLHHRLTENKEYRLKFADRVYRHFFNGGALTSDSNIARFKATADMLELAIIAESARWGDSKNSVLRTKNNDWLPAVNRVINDYMPRRNPIVLDQLIDAGLYLELKPPVVKLGEEEVYGTLLTMDSQQLFSIENPNTSGTIFYTTNGMDPRSSGGVIHASAINAGSIQQVVLPPGNHLMARIKDGEDWSPLHELIVESSDWNRWLKVTEIHYHPPDQGLVDGKDLEFIELKNTGPVAMDLSGLSFTLGVRFTFPAGTVLTPGAYIVLASDRDEFKNFYGFSPGFEYSGNLSNGGERLLFQTKNGQPVFDFTFYDRMPWPQEADGQGYSLVAAEINPTGDPQLVNYWTLSEMLHGSPMQDDFNSATSTENLFAGNFDYDIFPNPATDRVNIQFFLDQVQEVQIALVDLNGRVLNSLMNEKLPAGFHERQLTLSGFRLLPGLYLISFRTNGMVKTKKLIYSHSN